jgi:GTPase involved in cell partitioning and DNA repair
MSFRITYLLLTLFLLFSVNIYSQNKNDDFREKIENIKIEKLINKLELDDKTAIVFTEKYKAYAKDIRELNIKRMKAYKKMNENLESGNGLDTLVEQLMNYESEINNKREDFANELKAMLTPKQMASMIIFEKKFNNEIRKLLKEYRQNNRNKD